jgi:hypothetical protein
VLVSGASSGAAELDRPEIPVFFPVTRESAPETGSLETPSSSGESDANSIR